jgi:hypothetical protein
MRDPEPVDVAPSGYSRRHDPSRPRFFPPCCPARAFGADSAAPASMCSADPCGGVAGMACCAGSRFALEEHSRMRALLVQAR